LQKTFRLIPTAGLVETMGVALRIPFGVERDHNAHTVRMIPQDIFDYSGKITRIATPQKATNKRAKPNE